MGKSTHITYFSLCPNSSSFLVYLNEKIVLIEHLIKYLGVYLDKILT